MASPSTRWILVGATLVVALGAASAAWWYVHLPVAQHLALYYADAQGMNLVPVESTEDFARPDAPGPWAAALFDKLSHPADPKLVAAVSPQMTLAEATWSPPTWSLTVKLPSQSGTTQETLLAGALVRSYVGSYPGASKVKLRLLGSDGKPFAAQHLDLGDALTPADFDNRPDAAPHAGLDATLWWRTRDGSQLVPVKLPLSGGSGSPPHDAFDRLLAGPPARSGAFLAPVAPVRGWARWAGLQGDVAQVELGGGALPEGADGARFIQATVLTLTEFTSIKAVRFTHDHAPVERVVGAFDLAHPIARPASVNAPQSPHP